jgi:hypothetical protein
MNRVSIFFEKIARHTVDIGWCEEDSQQRGRAARKVIHSPLGN